MLDATTAQAAHDTAAVTGDEAPFVETVSMEQDPDQAFAGDRGTLAPEVRRVLVRLLQRRFLLAERHSDDWAVLIEHQQVIESRLHDLFVRLIVDPGRGVAYKQQVRAEELDVPILLRDEAYTRAETLVLVYLRTVYQRESVAGEPSVRVDVEEIEQTVLTYFTEADGDIARRQKAVRAALARLRQEGIVTEESEGRFLVSSLVEIVLSADRLRELSDWLRQQTAAAQSGPSANPGTRADTDSHIESGTDTDTDTRGDHAL